MYTQIVKKYSKFKEKYIVQERRKHEYFINRYYAHLIDPFFTKWAYDLKLTPNMVTVIAGALGVGASFCFFFQYWILGAILLQLHHFMDGADGNLARLTNQCSPFGAKLDKAVDQIVRFTLFFGLAFSIDVSLWIKAALIGTIYLDVWIVHSFVLPFIKKHGVTRAKWKEWFLDRGIIPAFDIFLIYFLISVFSIIGQIELVIYIIIVGKNLDWMYRVWECIKTKYVVRVQ